MGLTNNLRSISTVVYEPNPLPAAQKTLPANEIQDRIKTVCFNDMHYVDLISALGKLTTGGISYDDLIDNEDYFHQYISPDSESIKKKGIPNIIQEFKRGYPQQVGTHPSGPGNCFSKEVYNNLPEKIREICMMLSNERKRDVCLIGLLTALSAAFSRYRFYHGSDSDVKEYSPHILSLVIGAAGSGKGLTRYGNIVVESISRSAIEMAKISIINYKKAKAEYDRQLKDCIKEGKNTDDLMEPAKPTKYCFAMSASDTTQAALVEILYSNPVGGFAYDSEVDTMVQGNAKKDFGGFSDIIRKVFHHEPIARQRKGENESYVIQQPRLAVMLSGTHDQLKKLIPSEYNGLFSRQWFYSIPPAFTDYIPGKLHTDAIGELCYRLQDEVRKKADLWSDEIVTMHFSDEQEQELFTAMQDKKAMEEKYGGDIGASWLRMALTIKRIAVTLSAFEQSNTGVVPVNCWRTALALLPAIKAHCVQALNTIRSNQGKKDISKSVYDALKDKGMTDKQIADELGVGDRTIRRRKEKDWA